MGICPSRALKGVGYQRKGGRIEARARVRVEGFLWAGRACFEGARAALSRAQRTGLFTGVWERPFRKYSVRLPSLARLCSLSI